MKAFTFLLMAASALLSASAHAAIYHIGDSLSDSGALGFTYTNPVELSPLEEGRVWTQYVSNSIPAFCDDPKHCKWDPDTFYYTKRGNNYAVGGAGVTFDSTDILDSAGNIAKSYTSLHDQIHALTHNRALTAQDVITVWMGANDILAIAAGDPTLSESAVAQVAEVFNAEIRRLAKFGARIYVVTIPDLGKTPLGSSSPDGGAFLTYLTTLFNDGISRLSSNGNVTMIDSNALLHSLLSSGNFDNTGIYCSVIIDPWDLCGDPTTNPESSAKHVLPFVFADPIHPSYAAHRWIGLTIKPLIR